MNKLYYIYDEVPSSALYYISGFLIIGVLCYLILSKAIIPMFRERKDYTMLDKIKCLVICLMLVLIVLYLSYCLCSDLILKYRFENGKYDTVVGEIVVNSIEEKNYRYKSGKVAVLRWMELNFREILTTLSNNAICLQVLKERLFHIPFCMEICSYIESMFYQISAMRADIHMTRAETS